MRGVAEAGFAGCSTLPIDQAEVLGADCPQEGSQNSPLAPNGDNSQVRPLSQAKVVEL